MSKFETLFDQGTSAEGAVAFDMADLLRLSELRSRRNPGLSLLHHLLRETQKQAPSILGFIDDLRDHLPAIAR